MSSKVLSSTVETSERSQRSSFRSWLRRLPWTGWIAVFILSIYVAASLLTPAIAPYPPNEIYLGGAFDPPSVQFLLGTDGLGRDIFSRFLFGGTSILWSAMGASALSVILGGLIGIWLGFRGGLLDELAMRALEVAMSIPPIIFALLILGLAGSSPLLVVTVVGLLTVPNVSRVARVATLSLVEEDFIAAARARGESDMSIVLRELLPNVIGTLAVEFSIRTGFSLLFIAGLGFLGFGAQPPDPDWGQMINDGRGTISDSIWLVAAPSIAIAVLVTAVNLLTDALVRASGPRGRNWGGNK